MSAEGTFTCYMHRLLAFLDGRKLMFSSRDLERSVRDVCQKMYLERAKERGKDKTEEDAEEWFESIRNARFATDVFT